MPKKEKEEISKNGLSSQEAKKRLEKFGSNELERRKQLSWVKLLLAQFKSPLIYILLFAGLTTFFLKEWTDSIVIFLAVGLNTILGFIQEFKAEKALIALRKLLVSHTRVIRDGEEQTIEAKDLVPGDLAVLLTGDRVPADGLVVKGVDLHVNEAILTGESLPVVKEKDSQTFMGTVIASGRGKMIVEKTGQATKMGKIAIKLGQTVEEETPLKVQIGQFSKVLAVIFSLVCLVIFFEGIWRNRGFLEMFTLSVAVAVAAIPEGLVISLTVILTLGMQRILARKGLVRKLLAAETLGSVNIICADKTGTLTEGKMRVVKAEVGDKAKKTKREKILRSAALVNNLTNPLEIAMMDWAKEELKKVDDLIRQNPRVDEIPFSSEKKFIAILTQSSEKNQGEFFLSGAPEMIIEMSIKDKKERERWRKKLDNYTKEGLRVIAFSLASGNLDELRRQFAHLKKDSKKYDGHLDGDWRDLKLDWLGFLLFEDPVRAEVKGVLNLCKQAGIKVKVITGDYRHTAAAVINKLELSGKQIKDSQIMEGWELEKVSDEELVKKIDEIILFARTTPEQKIRIVNALQTKGHSVAMMGDGVNDALALKKADIGIVVGEASEVAKETADMVLLDSNFKTIVAAVEEGRGIFENIRKVILYLLADSFTEVVLIGGSLLLGLPIPLLPAQILWVNLVEDGFPGLALAFEPKDKNLMQEPPRDKTAPILDQEVKVIIFIIGIITDLLLFAVFLFLLKIKIPIEIIRTTIFAGLAIDSLFYVFSCKTLKKNIWQENLLSNKFLIFSVFLGIILLLAGIHVPFLRIILRTQELSLVFWGLILSLGFVNIALVETVKWLFLKKTSFYLKNKV